ncbi:MAG: hypothetical protein H0U52_00625 [Chloroflexi bacterium]|nr:hypothetical protein [Chloroflexota bacterium]
MTTATGTPTIILGSGSEFSFLDPEAATIEIEDIAFGLAAASRFAGQCVSRFTRQRVRYSVAEHCVRGARAAPPELAYPFLMHEAGEATCGDMVGPLKALFPQFRTLEKRCEASALKRFRVPEVDKVALKALDLRMLSTEQRDLMPEYIGKGRDWAVHLPLPIEIRQPWGFDEAAEEFLYCFRQLAPIELVEELFVL